MSQTTKIEITHAQLMLLMNAVSLKMDSLVDDDGEFLVPRYEQTYVNLRDLYLNVLNPKQSEF